MRETIQEAEQTEPLLSERLYDLARDVQNRNPGRALQAAEGSLRRGLAGDAQKQEEAARGEIGRLRDGIERAAETVLGDESEALRRARDELKNLSNELNQEISRNAPEEGRQIGAAAGSSTDEDARREEGQQGEGRSGDKEQAGSQQGERSPGSESQSDRQEGGGQEGGGQQGDGQQEGGQQTGQSGQESTRQQGEQANGGGRQRGAQAGQRQERGREQNRGGANTDQNADQAADDQPGQAAPRNRGRVRAGPRQHARRLSGGGDVPAGEPPTRTLSPMVGTDFLDWSDRLRDVEEMVSDPELRAEAARIRDRARGIRAELKRHSAAPNWNLVRVQVAEPLVELSDRVSEELLRRTSKQAVVPLDRDPVPPRYSEKTRRYYETIGSGR